MINQTLLVKAMSMGIPWGSQDTHITLTELARDYAMLDILAMVWKRRTAISEESEEEDSHSHVGSK